jgi:hypothetical protein
MTYTQDGRKVLLKDDGTWEYVKEDKDGKEKFHFRKTRWGMNVETVKKNEKSKLLSDKNDQIVYETEVNGLDCYVVYEFLRDKLAESRYSFTKTSTNKNDYILRFHRVKEILIKKYGKPISDDVDWDNELYRDDKSEWGYDSKFFKKPLQEVENKENLDDF